MYPAVNALTYGRIPNHLFHVDDELIYQPKLDGIWFKLNPKTMEGFTKNNKKYDFKRILKYYNDKMVPLCYHLDCIRYLVGELCYIDPITKKITRNRSFVMDFLREQGNWEDYAPYIVLVVFDVILEPEYVRFHLNCKPGEMNIYPGHSTYDKVVGKSYLKVFEYFVQDNIQLLKNDFIRCMESVTTVYGKAAEVEEYFMKKYEHLEGFIIKRANSIHPSYFGDRFRKVHPNWFKVKAAYDATLLCVDIKPHSKNPDMIGALILESSDKQLRVSVGSGLSLQLRCSDKNNFIGKLIEIEFEDLIPKSKMLLHPRYKEIRKDMTIADSWEKLISRI